MRFSLDWTDALTASTAVTAMEELRGLVLVSVDLIKYHQSILLHSVCVCVCVSLQNFLCYSCEEYVEDLSKIPKEALEVCPDP